MSHFKGTDFGHSIENGGFRGVEQLETGYAGFFDDVSSWATGVQDDLQESGLWDVGEQVANVAFQAGSTPQTVSQPSNVRYPTAPAGGVAVASLPAGASSFDKTLASWGVTKKQFYYGAGGFTSLLLLILLWPKKQRSSSSITVAAPAPAAGPQIIMMPGQTRTVYRRAKANPKLKKRRANSSMSRGATRTEVRSPTSTRTEVRSPTRTSTKTSTEADTQGNVTVTGGAGRGATSVTIQGYRPKAKSTRKRARQKSASRLG